MLKQFKFSFISAVFLVAVFGGLIGAYLFSNLRFSNTGALSGPSGISVPLPVLNQTEGIVEDEQTIAVVKRLREAVVSILVTKKIKETERGKIDLNGPFLDFEDILPPGGMQQIGGGSGFIVSPDGLIVTNRHVVEDLDAEYSVVFPDGTSKPAKIVSRDPVIDIAILDIEGDSYTPVTFGDSDSLQVGQTVLAIGNALDQFRNTVTKGIVSGLNRRLVAQDIFDAQIIEGAIQTDAAINPGNSGGPLIDLHGRVVGINTAVSLSGQLLGFALPGNLVKRDVDQVKKTGRITRPFLGVRYVIITPEVAIEKKLAINYGVIVSRGMKTGETAVVPGSPAEKADVREGDQILSIDGKRIDDNNSLTNVISRKSPGDIVVLRILRSGTERDVKIKLEEFK